jgi:hypothetical protein
MKTIWSVISVVSVAHLLAILAFMSFLIGTGRFDRARAESTRDIFRLSIAEQKEIDDAAAAEEAARIAQEEYEARLDAPNEGAETRINELRALDELLQEKWARMEFELASLQKSLEMQRQALDDRETDLQSEREQFEAERQRLTSLNSDEQFQKMVETFKGLDPEQQKSLIQKYLDDGDEQLAIDILDSLDKRTAQGVIEQFDSEEEIQTAAHLLKRLKDRGV